MYIICTKSNKSTLRLPLKEQNTIVRESKTDNDYNIRNVRKESSSHAIGGSNVVYFWRHRLHISPPAAFITRSRRNACKQTNLIPVPYDLLPSQYCTYAALQVPQCTFQTHF